MEERNVDLPIGFGVTRNTYSAHSKFSENTQAEKVVDRTGKPVGENSSNAQIRTLLDEQRQIIIAEYCEKVSHHELQAARAEQERRILQEDLWRQQKDFREVHQQSLTEMEELRKFQSSTFDTLARRKLIEDQNTIMELSGRLQELQNEVNCMSDSKDFQDAESVRSGNSHVTSQPMSFPRHPIPEGMLRPSFVSPCRKEGPPCIWDTSGISGNVFAHPQASSSAPYPQELNSTWKKTIEEPIHMSTAEKSERPKQNRCGHLMKDDTTENKKYISSVLDLFSIPNFYIRKGRPHGHRYGKAPGCKEYHTANQLQKKCRKKKYDNIHDRFIRDKFFRKTMIELGRSEEIILEMDQLASENHTHIATRAEIDVYRGNWWIRSNVVNFDTMPTRH